MIVERTENPQWLSNAYLVADTRGGTGVLIDGNDDLGPLLERAERDGIEITHILVTHPHADHVAGLAEAREQLGNPPLVAHAEATAAEIDDEVDDDHRRRREARAPAASRSRRSTPPATPPATSPSSSTAPTSSPPTSSSRARSAARWRPGASGFDDLKASVMRLMELPPETARPPRPPRADDDRRGVRAATPSCGSGAAIDATGEEQVTVWGRPATLKLWAPDYDGGNKAWIVFADSGEEAIVGGSQVERG